MSPRWGDAPLALPVLWRARGDRRSLRNRIRDAELSVQREADARAAAMALAADSASRLADALTDLTRARQANDLLARQVTQLRDDVHTAKRERNEARARLSAHVSEWAPSARRAGLVNALETTPHDPGDAPAA